MDFDYIHHEEIVTTDPAPGPSRAPRPATAAADPAHPLLDALHTCPVIAGALDADPALLQSAIRCITGSRAVGTVQGYTRTLKLFRDFCSNHNIPYPDFSSQDLTQYILHLDSKNVPLSFLATVKPAVQLLEKSLDRSTVFSGAVDLVLDGARRRAEARRGPRAKAPEVTRQDVCSVFSKLFLPFAADPREIPVARFGTLFRICIVYHTACRFDDFSRLRARDFERSGENILVTFPSAKNDQHHKGNTSALAASPSPLCPVKITVAFFQTFGLKFGLAAGDTSFVNFRSRGAGGHRVSANPKFSLSYSKATANLRATFRAAGIHTKATDKSIKMLAVTTAFASGGSSEQVMHLGRWASISTPEHYKHNSTDFKLSVSSLVPALLPL